MTDGEIEEASVSQLVSAVAETQSYAFLVGAGTSKPEPAGIPLAGELVEQWREECYDRDSPDADFYEWVADKEGADDVDYGGEYGFWFQERHRTSGQRREFIQDLVQDAPPTPGHVILASLMSDGGDRNYVPVTLTTNFDDLLFDSFYRFLEDKPQVVDHGDIAEEFELTRDRPAIIKLHGHYSYSNLRNTDEETASLHSGMERILERTVGEFGLVVIGYGGEEKSVMEPLKEAETSEYGIYWCARNPDNLSEDVEELLEGNEDAYVVPIEGFVSLMVQFAREIDDVEPPTRQELLERAEERAARLEAVVGERQEVAEDEEEAEYLDTWQMKSEASEAFDEDDYARAIELFNEVIDADSEDAAVYVGRGGARNELGEYEAALEDLNRAVDLDPENAVAYNNRGNSKRGLDEYKAAIEDFDWAIDLNPENTMAYNNRGTAKKDLGDLEAAIEDYNRAIDLDPENATAYNNRGVAKKELGDLEAAIDDYDRAIDLDPEYAMAYNNRGAAKGKLGDLEAAIDDYDRAIDLDRWYVPAFLNRAEARIQIEDFDGALEDAVEAQSLSDSPENRAASLMLHLVAATVLDVDAEEQEKEYRGICEEEFTTTWDFDELDSWLETADLDPEKQERIEELLDLLREHKE